jgi:hypothetical protein
MYSHEVMEDAIKEYGCNCDDCCSALMVNRWLDEKYEETRDAFLNTLEILE